MIYQVPAFPPRGPSLAAMLKGDYPPPPGGVERLPHICHDDELSEGEMHACIKCGQVKHSSEYYIVKRKSGKLKREKTCKLCRNGPPKRKAHVYTPNPKIAMFLTRRMTAKEFAGLAGVKPCRAHNWLNMAHKYGFVQRHDVEVFNNNLPSVYFSPLGWKP